MLKRFITTILIQIFCLNATNSYKVLIGSPVRQKPKILKEFLTSLSESEKSFTKVDYFFVDDNTMAESSLLLQDFKTHNNCVIFENKNKKDDYVCNQKTHCWNEEIVWKVADFKNKIIEYAKEKDYDYLVLIDSDIVMHPNTIECLIDKQKDIIANIWWTSWVPDTVPSPNAWLYDFYTQHECEINEKLTDEESKNRYNNFINKLNNPGTYEVGGVCGFYVLSKKAITSGVSFKRIKNILFWGEDRHFCVRAAALGFQIFIDTHFPAYHIYRESDLDGVAKYKEDNAKLNFKSIEPLLEKYNKDPENPQLLMAISKHYADENNLEESYKYLEKRIRIESNKEEDYLAFYNYAQLTEKIKNKKKWPKALKYYLKAYAKCPERVEPLVKIAEYYMNKDKMEFAYFFSSKACAIPMPTFVDKVGIDKEAYEYKRYDILGRCAWYVGQYEIGEEALKIAIKARPNFEHLQRNLSFYLNRKQSNGNKTEWLEKSDKPDLTIIGRICNEGINKLTENLINNLQNDLKINLINTAAANVTESSEIVKRLAQQDNNEYATTGLFICNLTSDVPNYNDILVNFKTKIAYAESESPGISENWVTLLNNMFDAIAIPDKSLEEIYKKAGIKIPIFILPIGLELDNYYNQPIKTKASDIFIFGTSGLLSDKNNLNLIIEAFAQEFGSNNNIRLQIHTRGGNLQILSELKSIIKAKNLNNVEIICNKLSNSEFNKFICSLDCYICLSSFSGISIGTIEAMAAGVPCIVSNNSAHKTICDTQLVIPVDLINKKINRALRQTYDNYEELIKNSNIAKNWAIQFNFKNLKSQYLSFLKPKKVEFGGANIIDDNYIITDSEQLYNKYINN